MTTQDGGLGKLLVDLVRNRHIRKQHELLNEPTTGNSHNQTFNTPIECGLTSYALVAISLLINRVATRQACGSIEEEGELGLVESECASLETICAKIFRDLLKKRTPSNLDLCDDCKNELASSHTLPLSPA